MNLISKKYKHKLVASKSQIKKVTKVGVKQHKNSEWSTNIEKIKNQKSKLKKKKN